MHTRRTSDYSPTMTGSRAEKQAINARAEMMKVVDSREVSTKGQRKNHDKRVVNDYNVIVKKHKAEQPKAKILH